MAVCVYVCEMKLIQQLVMTLLNLLAFSAMAPYATQASLQLCAPRLACLTSSMCMQDCSQTCHCRTGTPVAFANSYFCHCQLNRFVSVPCFFG